LSKGDLLQASEKLWGTAALAVKSVPANEGNAEMSFKYSKAELPKEGIKV